MYRAYKRVPNSNEQEERVKKKQLVVGEGKRDHPKAKVVGKPKRKRCLDVAGKSWRNRALKEVIMKVS